jgi:hypothetical protein
VDGKPATEPCGGRKVDPNALNGELVVAGIPLQPPRPLQLNAHQLKQTEVAYSAHPNCHLVIMVQRSKVPIQLRNCQKLCGASFTMLRAAPSHQLLHPRMQPARRTF